MVWMLTAECEQYGVATDSSVAADRRVWLLTAQCGCQKCGCRVLCECWNYHEDADSTV